MASLKRFFKLSDHIYIYAVLIMPFSFSNASWLVTKVSEPTRSRLSHLLYCYYFRQV